MAAPELLDLGEMVRGDTWNGIGPAIVFAINGSPPASQLASVLMQFRRFPNEAPAATLTSGESININSALNWSVTVPEQDLPLPAGVWFSDIQLTDAAGRVKTWIKVKLTVLDDYSREAS